MRHWQLVYVYTTDTDKGRFKIGMTTQAGKTPEEAIWTRINQQRTASDSHRNFKLVTFFDAEKIGIKALDLETYFHNELKNYKIQAKDKKKSEWFECTLDDINSVFNKLVFQCLITLIQ